MKSRVILTTIVAFVLLAAAVGAGLNAIFTVTLVDTEFTVYSEAGRDEAEKLKAELDGYVGSSTTFLDLGDVEQTVKNHPHFRVVSVEKQFPKTVKVQVAERKEFYAVKKDEAYAVLDEDGVYLYDGENNNRLGGSNIELIGFDCQYTLGERVRGEYLDKAFEMFAEFSKLLPGVRANIVSLRLGNIGQDTPENKLFIVTMREGVQIVISNLSEEIAVKARVAFTDAEYGYLSPAFKEKCFMYGAITVGNLTGDGTSAHINYRDDFTY